jgi:hypothetical protein
MPATDLHLAVHIAAWWTTAAYASGSTNHPLYFDGQPHLPSGVFLDPVSGSLLTATAALAAGSDAPDHYLPDPMAALQAPAAAGTGMDPAAAVTAVLAHVANHAARQAATAVTTLTVVTDQAWGHRARQRLHQAATAAGLPPPHIVTTAAAVAATADTGRFVIIGTPALELTVLDRDNDHQQLATVTARHPTAGSIDEELVRSAARDAGSNPALDVDWPILRDIHLARTTLATRPRTPVLLPPPSAPGVLERADLAAAAAPHLTAVEDHLKQLLADADLDPADITTVILVGDDAVLPQLGAALEHAGLPAATTTQDPHAVVRGALALTQPLTTTHDATAATTRLPRARITLTNLARVAVLAACSVALLLQTIAVAQTWKDGVTLLAVELPTENLGLAAALAAVTAWTAAQLAPTTWLVSSQADDASTTAALLRRGYFGAATVGLAVAGLWGMATGVAVGFINDAYLRTALTAAAPLAICAAIIAVAAPRMPQNALPQWLRVARPPVTPIAVAALGVLLQWASLTMTFPANVLGMPGLLQAVGAALLGAATAFTITRQPLLRVITAVILGIGYALLTNAWTTAYMTNAYSVALAWWALTVAFTTLTTATPQVGAWIKRWTGQPT